MERLQRWFGGGGGGDSGQPKPAKDNLAVGRPLLAESPPITTATATSATVTPAKTAPSPTSLQKLELELPDIPSDARATETTVGQFMKQGRDLVLRVVPLAEGDCLSCKLIGSGVMWGAALFVLFSYSKAKERFKGYRRPLFAVQALSLATGLMLLGTARFFDLSLFAPADAGQGRKPVSELIQEDFNNIHKLLTRSSSSKNGSKNNNDT